MLSNGINAHTGISGNNLKKGFLFNPDPYVKVSVVNGCGHHKDDHHTQHFSTKHLEATTCPTWKEQVLVNPVIEQAR